jgi:hypothetical protein
VAYAEGRIVHGGTSLAPEPAARTLRTRRRWLLIGPPVVLLFGRGANTLVQLALGTITPERLVLTIVLAVLSILSALLLVQGGRWGWLLAVGILGANLAGEIGLWWFGQPDYLAMALLALCAFLITMPEMRAAYVDGERS